MLVSRMVGRRFRFREQKKKTFQAPLRNFCVVKKRSREEEPNLHPAEFTSSQKYLNTRCDKKNIFNDKIMSSATFGDIRW